METVKAPDSHPEIILERIIRENQVSLKRLCYLYLHDEAMAEDAVQETFLKAFRSLGDFRGEANGSGDSASEQLAFSCIVNAYTKEIEYSSAASLGEGNG